MPGGQVEWTKNDEPLMTVDDSRRAFRDVVLGLEYREGRLTRHSSILPSLRPLVFAFQSITKVSSTATSSPPICSGRKTVAASRSQTLGSLTSRRRLRDRRRQILQAERLGSMTTAPSARPRARPLSLRLSCAQQSRRPPLARPLMSSSGRAVGQTTSVGSPTSRINRA